MAAALTATLLGGDAPRRVQLVLAGTTAGQRYVVTGSAAGTTWQVPGGGGVSTGAQVLLVDTRCPLNVAVTYTATVAGSTLSASPVTVSYGARALIQSLDGLTVIPVAVGDNADPRELDQRAITFSVPGRRRPPVRIAVGGDGGGTLMLDTVGQATRSLEDLILTGAPMVLRTDGTVLPYRDAVEILLPQSASHQIWGASQQLGDKRRWSLPYILLDDPEPDTVLGGFTWNDVDEAIGSTRTWDDLDTVLTGLTWDQVDAYDWSQL